MILCISDAERNRFNVYANDFSGHGSSLFLEEMNRGKRYDGNSNLLFFQKVYIWLMRNIVILDPHTVLSSTDSYCSAASIENLSRLIQTFDTGITEIGIKRITVEELSKMVPKEVLVGIMESVLRQMQLTGLPEIQMSRRFENGFFNIHISGTSEPEITTLVLKHERSFFDFDFSEESDGTKRLLDLVDMIMTSRDDVVFVVDELDCSLHPKLTEHFLKLFIEAHMNNRVQLIFTTHEDTVMDTELFRRDEIWFIERGADGSSHIYSLDRFKVPPM